MARSSNPENWMRRAVQLSRRGFPAPNPHVGCVIVRDDESVGEGWHHFAGGLHAEAVALRKAVGRAKGAEAFVTLEPCNHQGRQPPCAQALIHAGIQKVWIACGDPNPNVAGGGAQALLAAGVEVEMGLLEAEARQANRVWVESMKLQRPYVTIKTAMTLDGRVALPSGESKWITGELARREARRLRAEMGAVLVGSGTVAHDDPELMAKLPGVKNPPIRIVLDPERCLDSSKRVFKGEGEIIRVVQPGRANESDLTVDFQDGFDLNALMKALWARGLTSVLVEGGSKTISSFLAIGLADRLMIFVGNVVFGSGLPWVEAALFDHIEQALRWELIGVKRLGNDVCMKFEPLGR